MIPYLYVTIPNDLMEKIHTNINVHYFRTDTFLELTIVVSPGGKAKKINCHLIIRVSIQGYKGGGKSLSYFLGIPEQVLESNKGGMLLQTL